MTTEPLPRDPICPFCGEAFPGRVECPAHGLTLVDRAEGPDDLDREPTVPIDDRVLALHDLRGGRGWVALAAVAFLVGLALPLVRTAPGGGLVATGFQVALERAPHLWAVPSVGLWLGSLLRHRRTLRRLRGARLAVPVLGLLPAVAVAYAFWRMARAASVLREVRGIDVPVEPLAGVWVVGVGVVATLVAGFRLGSVHPRR